MDFRLLGPLEVGDGGREVHLRGARQRALLGVLLVHANRVVSTDRLLEDVWGDSPPASGPAALQMRITELRRALSRLVAPRDIADLLATVGPGYQLRVGPDDVDSLQFERLVAQGRALAADDSAAAAAACLRGALELWRGPALADFAFEPFAQGEIARLEDLRLTAVEDRVDADLTLAKHSALVPELEALVSDNPLRERLRAQLMLAHYRSGRQAEALACYRNYRRDLADELGLEPGSALQALEEQVLRQAPDLDLRARIPAPRAPAPSSPDVLTRKPMTVVCLALRIEGESARSLDPERRSRALARCRTVVAQTFEQHGAHVEDLPGVTLAAFGVPVVRDDDAVRAVRATVTAHERVRGLADQLAEERSVGVAARSGLATGELVTRPGHLEESLATGEPVEAALALMAQAGADDVLLADTTEPLVRHATLLTQADGVRPSTARRVTGLTAEQGSHRLRRDAPLVGRSAELHELSDVVERAIRERRLQTCTVIGPAGVGKSRLVEEFAVRAGRSVTVVRSTCAPHGEQAALWPLRQVVESIASGRPLPEVLASDEQAELVAGLVASAAGLKESEEGGDVFWAIGRFLEAASRTSPLLVILEDLHWASPSMLALVQFLAGWPRPARVALVCLARPELQEERDAWGYQPGSRWIELPPLDPDESEALLRYLADPRDLADDVRARVLSAAEGNPLFLEQLLAMLSENPALSIDTDLPPTIAALLAARLDRLGPGERAVTQRAAVIGREFDDAAVTALLPEAARATALRHLAALVARDLIEPGPASHGQASHRFRHGLVQAAAYRGTPTGARADLHEALAEWLPGAGTADDEVVGHHLERAFRCRQAIGIQDDRTLALARRAARRLRAAGEQAHRRGDMPGAANLLQRARDLAGGDDATAVEVLPSLGYALFEVGQLGQATEVLTDAVDRAESAGNTRVKWAARVTLLHLQLYLHPDDVEADDCAHQAMAAVEALDGLDDDTGVVRALMLLSDIELLRGSATRTQAAVERGLIHAARARCRREEAWCRGQLGFALINGPVPVAEGLERVRRMLTTARQDLLTEANLLPFLAVHESMHGDFGAAREHAAAGRSANRELGLRWQGGIHSLLSGYVELNAGDPVAAETYVRSALAAFTDMGDRWLAEVAAADLPRCLVLHGEYEQARVALAGSPRTADPEVVAKRCGVAALLLAREGQLRGAEALAREAVTAARSTDFLGLLADAHLDLADVLDLAGRIDAAAEARREALRLFTLKEHVVGQARAAARLSGSAAKITAPPAS